MNCQQQTKTGIYMIINKLNENYYVGSAIDFEKRWSKHKRVLNRNKHHSIKLQNAWNKYGEHSFEFKIVEPTTEQNLLVVEQQYLDKAKTEQDKCYNVSFEASAFFRGCKHSDETKQRISKSLIGNHFRLGIPHSEESKKKISQSGKGIPKSNEWKVKVSNSLKGRTPIISEEARKRAGDKLRGKPRSDEVKNQISLTKTGTKRHYLPDGSFVMVKPSH